MKRFSALTLAIIVLIAANLSSSLSDVAVKLLAGGISPFQYIFIRQLLCVLLLLPFWLNTQPADRQLSHVNITLIRAHLVLIGSGCMMVAITHLPLATANAIFYGAPLIMLPLSVWLLSETVSRANAIATVIGFIGVLIVLRPSQFHWAALFALACTFTLALFHILVKKLPAKQPVVITLFWTNLLSLPVAGLLTVIFWQTITLFEIGLIAISAVFTMGYHAGAVFSYKRANSSHIALAEYSGLIFVGLMGMLWFDEYPDAISLLGIALIIAPILLKGRLNN